MFARKFEDLLKCIIFLSLGGALSITFGPRGGRQIQGKFDSINTQLNSAKEIYSDAVEQDVQAVVSEAEAEALAALEEGGDVSTFPMFVPCWV